MNKEWKSPPMDIHPTGFEGVEDGRELSDTEMKVKPEESGFSFTKTYQAKSGYVHRKIGGTDVLITIGENIADFNGYIELNESAVCLWECLQEPCTMARMEQALKDTFGISAVRAAADAREFINHLQEHNMVTVR